MQYRLSIVHCDRMPDQLFSRAEAEEERAKTLLPSTLVALIFFLFCSSKNTVPTSIQSLHNKSFGTVISNICTLVFF